MREVAMLLALQIILLALLVGILVYTVIIHFASSRTFKVVTLLIILIVTVPVLALCIYVFVAKAFDPPAKMYALASGAVVLGFWFKSPLANITQG
jgi:ABC-type amino acid transport system permease subunit